jgi:hypothetical protein
MSADEIEREAGYFLGPRYLKLNWVRDKPRALLSVQKIEMMDGM